jgi:hypothetical protein
MGRFEDYADKNGYTALICPGCGCTEDIKKKVRKIIESQEKNVSEKTQNMLRTNDNLYTNNEIEAEDLKTT